MPAEHSVQAPSLENWPGERVRDPKKSSVTYPTRIHLARWLEEEAKRVAADFGRFSVLDIGCGRKPYFPYFAQNADEYVGIDIAIDNPMADLHAPVEDLPVENESFDVVLCTQVLEHCGVPDQAVTEFHRVTKPGGRVFASTHGVQVYHPAPEDHWRWTHTGLELLFLRNAAWRSVTVQPAGGSASCLASMTGIYLDALFRHIHLTPAAKGLVWLLNSTGAGLDRRVPALREPRPGSIFLNYHVVAEKAA